MTKNKILSILILLFFIFELAKGQFENYDIKSNKIKQLKKVYLRYHYNDSISKDYGYQINFDTVGLIAKKESWLYPPLQSDTTIHLYHYKDHKLDKIIFKGSENYDNYQYDSFGFLIQINRYRDGVFNYSFTFKNNKKGRLIERYYGNLESFEYDSLGRIIRYQKTFNDSTFEVSQYIYSSNDLVNKEISEYHQGKNFITTIINNWYNANNDLIKLTSQNDFYQKTDIMMYSYIYNHQGDWIYKLTISNGKIHAIEKREIEYY